MSLPARREWSWPDGSGSPCSVQVTPASARDYFAIRPCIGSPFRWRLSLPITSIRKITVSAPELANCRLDIVEIAALRGGAGAMADIAAARGLGLPEFGRTALSASQLTLCVRPDRWLALSASPAPTTVSQWQSAFCGRAAVMDMSSGLSALLLSGPHLQLLELLARGCRLDLDPEVRPEGFAVATVMAQVMVILAALPSGMLVLTPSTTVRHLRDWLVATGTAFGLEPIADTGFEALPRERST